MITELIRFNCHVLDVKQHQDGTTPEQILAQYKTNTEEMVFEGVVVEIDTVNWASGKTSILTKVKRKV